MFLRETTLKDLRIFITTAFIACLALPGSAFATVMLDLSSNNPIFTANYASGSIFTDPAGLGWDLTVTSSGDSQLRTNSAGVGVEGNSNPQLNANEWIRFDFVPDAMLAGFEIVSGDGDLVAYSVNDGAGPVGLKLISGSPELIPFLFISTASTLVIGTTGDAEGYRVGSLSFADAVPEPAVLGLLGLGLLGMGGARRMRKAV